MDLSELRDLLDYLENQGVDENVRRRVFQRYYSTNEDKGPQGQDPGNAHNADSPHDQSALATNKLHPK